MNRTALRALALALPLVGLAATWDWTHVRTQQGVEWWVPIEGYDPRDLLRGHYIVYRYKWPGLKDGVPLEYTTELCIEGQPPHIARAFPPDGRPCPHPLRAPGYAQEGIHGLASGMLYVSQEEARSIQKDMRNPDVQGLVRIRVRDDGLITPLYIRFHVVHEF